MTAAAPICPYCDRPSLLVTNRIRLALGHSGTDMTTPSDTIARLRAAVAEVYATHRQKAVTTDSRLDLLRAQRDALENLGAICNPSAIQSLLALLDAQAVQVEGLRADAERYRWLRENAVSYPQRDDSLELVVPVNFADKWAEMTDSAIDAARAALTKEAK